MEVKIEEMRVILQKYPKLGERMLKRLEDRKEDRREDRKEDRKEARKEHHEGK